MNCIVMIMLSALFFSLAELSAKKSLKDLHALQFSMILKLFELVMILFFISMMDFSVPLWVYFAVYGLSMIATAANLLTTKGMRHLEISSMAPLTNLSPFFLIVIAYFFLGETLTLVQFIGIILLVLGVYYLEARDQEGVWQNIRHLLTSRYVVLVIFAYFLYSFTATGEKFLLDFIGPVTLLFLFIIFMGINFFIVSSLMYGGYRDLAEGLGSSGRFIAVIAVFSLLSKFFYVFALKAAFVSLVIPIKRLSTLFTTILGGKLFHESDVWRKVAACIVMIAGIFFIAI
ncbi:DMT family transporter [Candidatus Woesearchaeota archaeon]|nr:DMT family transporter [Candidatus Woesearchaeota archaeon]